MLKNFGMPLLLFIFTSLCYPCEALKLPKIMTSNMVLAAEHPKVFGWSSRPSASITGMTSDTGESVSRQSGPDGFFSMEFKSRDASMVPFSITLKEEFSGESIVLKNLLAGDIWVCSGQSNMEFAWPAIFNAADVTKHSLFKGVRLFASQNNRSDEESDDIIESQYRPGWVQAGPDTVCGAEYQPHSEYCKPHCGPVRHCVDCVESFKRDEWGYFSAVCLAHGIELFKATGRPQGLVESAKGGSTIIHWASKDALQECGGEDKWVEATTKPGIKTSKGVFWNSKIVPLLKLPVRGIVWWLGEGAATIGISPRGKIHAIGNKYECLLHALIKDWRSKFANGWRNQFTYLSKEPTWITVQLAAGGDFSGGFIRLAQQAASTLHPPGVGVVVGTDLYDKDSPCGSVHPRNKYHHGWRIAQASLNLAYNRGKVHWQSPIATSVVQTSQGIKVNFAGDGPVTFRAIPGQTREGALQSFEVTTNASLMSGWHPCPAKVLSTSSVLIDVPSHIYGIRYSWGNVPRGELLYDGSLPEGASPAGPFLALCEPGTAKCKLVEGGNLPQMDELTWSESDEAFLFRNPIA